jgi:hypothetical protein
MGCFFMSLYLPRELSEYFIGVYLPTAFGGPLSLARRVLSRMSLVHGMRGNCGMPLRFHLPRGHNERSLWPAQTE